jgi:thiol:disulfide interchange protein
MVKLAIGVAVLAGAWWIVGLPPFSLAASVAVLSAGAAAAVVGSRFRRKSPASAGSIVPWVVLVAMAGAWELAAYLQHPRTEHPTLSSLVNAVLDSHPARAAAFVVWLAGCAALARR